MESETLSGQVLFVLVDEGGDELRDFILLPSGQAGRFFEDFPQFTFWPAVSLNRHGAFVEQGFEAHP